MRLVFYSNFLNIHQVSLMDALYKLLDADFRFVATLPRNAKELKGGEDYSTRPYCILAAESGIVEEAALRLAVEAEACVFGACSQAYAVERAKRNPMGLSFEMGERWLKHGWLTIGSPVFRKWMWNYYQYYRKANFYKLCCSAFAAGDDERLNAYSGRHYKWGYFTRVDNYEVEAPKGVSTSSNATILWCARFLKLKHPELAVKLAVMLKLDGYNVHIDMYGDGPEFDATIRLKEKEQVDGMVTLYGNVPNKEVIKAMRSHDIFLFTSDKNEGWGAVANESMANGCVLVASDAVGSTHYLVEHKKTGMIFQSCNIDSLYEQVKFLLDHPIERNRIANRGRELMVEMWNPVNAAENLLILIEHLQSGKATPIKEGPCSKA